jgi:hypothetical protein
MCVEILFLTSLAARCLTSAHSLRYLFCADSDPDSWLADLNIFVCRFLSVNQFSGALPSTLGLLAELQTLYSSLCRVCAMLKTLDFKLSQLNANLFSGNLPCEIGNLVKLNALSLNNNSFTGPVPDLSKLTSLMTW